MKKITREEFNRLNVSQTWDHIKSLQTELEEMNRQSMSKNDIAEYLVRTKGYLWIDAESIAEDVQALTVKQGFVADWSKAPYWADCVRLYWARKSGEKSLFDSLALYNTIPRPTPTKVERERTKFEMENELVNNCIISRPVADKLSYDTMKDLCTAAGISLTVLEEV